MRSIETVLDKIIHILGENGFGESDLAIGLYGVKKDAMYTAPESMVGRWMEAHALLYFQLLNIDGELVDKLGVEEKAQIFSIFSDKPEDEVLESLKSK